MRSASSRVKRSSIPTSACMPRLTYAYCREVLQRVESALSIHDLPIRLFKPSSRLLDVAVNQLPVIPAPSKPLHSVVLRLVPPFKAVQRSSVNGAVQQHRASILKT